MLAQAELLADVADMLEMAAVPRVLLDGLAVESERVQAADLHLPVSQSILPQEPGHLGLQALIEAIVAHRFKEYQPYKGEIEHRNNGSLVSIETGQSIAYSMNKLLDRGRFFVEPGEDIYAGQVVGEHTRERDLNINICKTKKLTNVRAAGSDEKIILPPAIKFSLEEALEYIQDDELVEVTPHFMRIRKILLDPLARKRNSDNED